MSLVMLRLLAVLVLLSRTTFAVAQTVVDYEDVDKTMVVVERAFRDSDVDGLLAVSTTKFMRSSTFETLARAIERRQRLSSAYSGQIAEQVFDVEPGTRRLRITFILRNDLWLIENAEELDKNDNAKALPRRGFDALAREYGFSDFKRAAEAGTLWRYSGVAPYGRLAASSLKGKRLSAAASTSVTVTNLMVHDGNSVNELYYLRLEKFVQSHEGRRGWLIAGGGTMLEFELRRRTDAPLLHFLTGNKDALDLSKPSAFAFSNAPPSSPNTPTVPQPFEGYRIKSVAVDDFAFDPNVVRFAIRIRCEGASWKPPVTVERQGGAIIVSTNSDVRFVPASITHSYLDVRVDSAGNLRIARKLDAQAPFGDFTAAVVGEPFVRERNSGVDFFIPLETRRK